MVALVPVPLVLALATVEAPFMMATVNWSDELIRPPTVFTSVSWGRLPFVNVHEMTSPARGVTVKLVPLPDGSVVVDRPFEFEQLMLAAYWPMTLALPAAIASVSVYVVPDVTVCVPVDALAAAPEVVAEASVVAPWVMATVNWSDESSRLLTDLLRLRVGAAATTTLLVAGLLSEVDVVVSITAAPMWPMTEFVTVPTPLLIETS